MYPYFVVFGFPVSAYWLMGVLGLACASLYVMFTNRGRRAGWLPGEDVLHIGCFAIVGALVGSKLLHLITILPRIISNWDYLMANNGELFMLLTSGFVFYGGAIGGFLMVYWYCRMFKISIKTVFSLMTPAIPLFHAFGRIGCFLGGCCWGVPVSWGVVYPQFSLGAPSGIPLLPVQLIEAACNLVLFVVLAWLSHRLARRWMVMPLYILCYGVLRFILEFFRGDAERGVLLFSTSQWISLALVLAVALLYIFRWRGQKDTPDQLPPPSGGFETVPPQMGNASTGDM